MYYLKTLDWMRISRSYTGELCVSKEFNDAQSFDTEIEAYNFYKDIYDRKDEDEYKTDYIEIVKIFTFKWR